MRAPWSASELESPEGRLRLPIDRNGFSVVVSPGARLNYRRSVRSSGTWSVLLADGKRSFTMRRIAIADDLEPADGVHVMNYQQARAAALATARTEREARSRLK